MIFKVWLPGHESEAITIEARSSGAARTTYRNSDAARKIARKTGRTVQFADVKFKQEGER